MITRRKMLSAGGLCAFGLAAETSRAFAALPVPPGNILSFRIMRKDNRIGTHVLNFSRSGDDLSVDIAVTMAVYFGPIRMFHYDHRNTERWKNGSLDSLDAKTDYNGEPAWCTIRRDGGQFVVEGSKAVRYIAPAGTLAATHWNRAELNGPMVNPENGALLKPAISYLGTSAVSLASGASETAHHYAWRGKDDLDLWYDAQSDWTALKAVTKSGEVLTYEKL